MVPVSGMERESASQGTSTSTHRATCPFFEDASSEMRIRRNERILHVNSVVDEGGNRRKLSWRLVEQHG